MDTVVAAEERLTLSQAAAREGVNRATIFRWWKVGVGGVRLATRRQGGRRVTDSRSLAEFHAAVNARDQAGAPETQSAAAAPAPQRAMRQRLAAADREFKTRVLRGSQA